MCPSLDIETASPLGQPDFLVKFGVGRGFNIRKIKLSKKIIGKHKPTYITSNYTITELYKKFFSTNPEFSIMNSSSVSNVPFKDSGKSLSQVIKEEIARKTPRKPKRKIRHYFMESEDSNEEVRSDGRRYRSY